MANERQNNQSPKGRLLQFPGSSKKRELDQEFQSSPRLPGKVIDLPKERTIEGNREIQFSQNEELTEADEEALEEEERIAEQLAAVQEVNEMDIQLEETYNEGKSYDKPSKFKYFILFGIAAIIDIIDLLTLTGLGLIIVVLVSFCLSVLIYFIFWVTNTKQKNAQEYPKKIEAILTSVEKNVEHLERRAVQVTRFISNSKFVKNSKVFAKGAAKLEKVSQKLPFAKYIAAALANLVPFLGLVPWQIVGVWLSYRDEKRDLQNANGAANSVFETAESLTESLSETLAA